MARQGSSDHREPRLPTTRRTVVRGVAWTLPVVAMAATAPAYAASPCDTTYSFRLDWGVTPYTPPANLTAEPNRGTATVTPTANGVPGALGISVTLESTLQGTTTRFDQNLNVLGTTGIGGLTPSQQGVAIRSTNVGGLANTQTIRVTFGRPVSNVSFSVVDLDRATNFWDRVSFNPLPTGFTRALGTVSGIGAYTADPLLITANSGAFRYTGLNTTGLDDTSGAGVVTVNYAGGPSFTSFDLLYWSTSTPGPQGILLSDFTFNARGC
ncbi:hypothetical protein EUA06_05335 [Nocardioides glacieisoli]|uniref:Uncharacterized protein n=1 Tax=Nocardioides glacieisoli TaxID=1168730 RepID=A0A4Q2RTH1_9ACTN|nr:hypothetical protein [Nocardioides glacieisoli]RYB92381.1 hypothetical protein EUA06_05335 [Nocardioides glacieisoli]